MALDRRGFVRGCAALLASATLPGRAAGASAAPAEASRFGGFQPGIQSFSLRAMELPEALDTVAALGLEQIELIPRLGIAFIDFGSHFPVTDDAGEIARVRALLDARGLRLGAHGVNDVDGPESAERLAVFAEAAGTPVLTVSPDRDVLPELDPVLAAHPTVRFAIHNHGPGTSYATIADVESALAGRHPGLGACVDTGHFIRSGEDPVEALRRIGPRVFGVHLKDFGGAGLLRLGDDPGRRQPRRGRHLRGAARDRLPGRRAPDDRVRAEPRRRRPGPASLPGCGVCGSRRRSPVRGPRARRGRLIRRPRRLT